MRFQSRLHSYIRMLPGVRRLRLLHSLYRGSTPEERETARLQLQAPDNLFQPSGFTKVVRHPALLRFLQAELTEQPRPLRLLSFGCSTGEELASLSISFPDSLLTGIDISPQRLTSAGHTLSRLQHDGRLTLLCGSSAAVLPEDGKLFDAVFALSVFRHHDLWSRPRRCDRLIRFADYERTVTGLAQVVRPGGFYCQIFSNFAFHDTAVAAGLTPRATIRQSPGMPLYGPDNLLRSDPAQEGVIYQKHPATADSPPVRLIP